MITIGEKIKKIRKSKNISQDKLAELLIVSNKTISSWECDRTTPDINMLIKISSALDYNFYDLIITSDHGNCEYMKDEDGNVMTGHTSDKVPFVICNDKYKLKKEGSLCDVVPTITDVYEISRPNEMTGESLIIKNE